RVLGDQVRRDRTLGRHLLRAGAPGHPRHDGVSRPRANGDVHGRGARANARAREEDLLRAARVHARRAPRAREGCLRGDRTALREPGLRHPDALPLAASTHHGRPSTAGAAGPDDVIARTAWWLVLVAIAGTAGAQGMPDLVLYTPALQANVHEELKSIS